MDITSGLDDLISTAQRSPWLLLVILIFAATDSVVPAIPSETAVIFGGVAAGQGDQLLVLVVLVAWLGAFVGDNLSYSIGRWGSTWVRRKATTRPKLDRGLAWAGRQLEARGGLLLVTGRFIPGGRTLLTMSSGLTRQPRPWFMGWAFLAGGIWAGYAAGLGFVFGDRMEGHETAAFLAAFAAALLINGLIELVRHFRGKSAPARP